MKSTISSFIFIIVTTIINIIITIIGNNEVLPYYISVDLPLNANSEKHLGRPFVSNRFFHSQMSLHRLLQCFQAPK